MLKYSDHNEVSILKSSFEYKRKPAETFKFQTGLSCVNQKLLGNANVPLSLGINTF